MEDNVAFVILPDPCVSRCNFGALSESEQTGCSWIHSLLTLTLCLTDSTCTYSGQL